MTIFLDASAIVAMLARESEARTFDEPVRGEDFIHTDLKDATLE